MKIIYRSFEHLIQKRNQHVSRRPKAKEIAFLRLPCLTLFLFFNLSLSAQLWQTELPYTSTFPIFEIRDFITTNDKGFLVLLRDVVEEDFFKITHVMVKYDSLGNLEWERVYDFGINEPEPSSNSAGATPRKVIQLANNNYLMTGGYRDGTFTSPYIFITNSEGDSLLFSNSPSSRDLQYVNQEIFAFRTEENDIDTSFIMKINDVGEVVEETNLEGEPISTFVINKVGEVYTHREQVPKSYKKHRPNGTILYDKFTPDHAEIIIKNELGGITAFDSDLIKMDSILDIVWSYMHEDIYPTIPDNGLTGSDIIQTKDDGIVIASYINDDFFTSVFMTKYSSEGERLWGGSYPGSVLPMTYLHQVKEVSDGLVVLGGNRFTEKIWLVKLLENGWITSTENVSDAGIDMNIYPNPGSGELNVRFSQKVNGVLNIINAQGQKIKEIILQNTDFEQSYLADIPNGFYWIQFVDKNGYRMDNKYLKV